MRSVPRAAQPFTYWLSGCRAAPPINPAVRFTWPGRGGRFSAVLPRRRNLRLPTLDRSAQVTKVIGCNRNGRKKRPKTDQPRQPLALAELDPRGRPGRPRNAAGRRAMGCTPPPNGLSRWIGRVAGGEPKWMFNRERSVCGWDQAIGCPTARIGRGTFRVPRPYLDWWCVSRLHSGAPPPSEGPDPR